MPKTYQARVWVQGWSWQEVETNDISEVADLAEVQARDELDKFIEISEAEIDNDSIKLIADDTEED